MTDVSRILASDEIHPHYEAFIETCVKGLGFCVRYDVGYATGYIADPRDTRWLARFPTWMEAYTAAVRHFAWPDHPAYAPA